MKNNTTGLTKPKLIQLIHIAKSQLHLDEDTYRAMLQDNTGKNSTKAMTYPELQIVFDDLKKKGFKTTSPTARKNPAGDLRQADDEQSKLIRHLWLSLHDLGEVRDPSEKALANYVSRQTGIQFLQWLPTHKASTVIESLKKWQLRILKPRAEAFLKTFNDPRLNSFTFTPELLDWVHQTAKGKYTRIAESDYTAFTQAYQSLTKTPSQ